MYCYTAAQLSALQDSNVSEEKLDMDMLPKVPVPDLQHTLNMYLRSVKHVVSKTQFCKTKAMVEMFGKPGGLGERLQKQLLERRDATENWMYEYWLDDMYLKNRLALPVNSSPALVFPKQPFRDFKDSLMFAAHLIRSVSEYKLMVDSCIVVYEAVSATLHLINRRCLLNKDTLFFVLNVTGGSSQLNDTDVQEELLWIYEQTQNSVQKQPAVGLLTSDSRTEWSKAREKLLKDPINRESLELMESCMCIICLDEPMGFQPSDTDRALMMLHGVGPNKNGANRWYDKPLQFVIGADGVCGVIPEHSPSEGIVVVQCAEYLLKHMRSGSGKASPGLKTSERPRPCRLVWRCSADVQEMLDSAADHLQSSCTLPSYQDIQENELCAVHSRIYSTLVRNLDMNIFTFQLYGKEFIKQQKMSPDAYIQVALQLAIYRCYRRPVATYESASLRRFHEGRVDNIRSATSEALEFVKAMTDDATSIQDTEKMKKLQTAVDTQTEITALVTAGMGTDNHLLGLREMAEMMKIETPDIFTDETYGISNNFILSTSQVPTTMEMFCCYGPVIPDGYGVCYNPQSDHIVFCVSSFRGSQFTCSGAFVKALDQALQDTRDVVCTKPPEKQQHHRNI
ncbi:choline O-acetyltransferase-like [Triplophysa rosa]|uniref:choline O-acetyltransferase-like n=1 Tax=Triplophysa rosa TaxID=992332 RepID=UPI002545BF5C|nr:choline O-acetyltransferase-like [Triplophysa rosa]